MGLLARHVAFQGEWPIFFYGQVYMGPIEGYVAALLFRILGASSLFVLRLSLLPFFVAFLLVMYFLVRSLYTRRFALFTTLLFALGAPTLLSLQLRAVGEYPEIELFAAVICLLTYWLIRDTEGSTRLRFWLYALLGLTFGVAIWVDMLILPFVGISVILLLIFRYHDLWSWRCPVLIMGFIVGLLPLIIYNIHVPLSQNSIFTLMKLQSAGKSTPLMQLFGTFGIALPSITNALPLYPDADASVLWQTTPVVSCLMIAWSLGYLGLWTTTFVVSLKTAIKVIRAGYRPDDRKIILQDQQRQKLARTAIVLMILISSLATILLYLKSPASGLVPQPTTRYLTCVIISLPSVIWPLWQLASHAWSDHKYRLAMLPGRLFLVFLAGTYLYGSIYTLVHETPKGESALQKQEGIVRYLQENNVQYFYTEYWTCNNIIFLSSEKIQCAVLGNSLHLGYNRYPAYQENVSRHSNLPYVFPLNTPQVALMDQKLKKNELGVPYTRVVHGGMVYYLPQKK